MAQITYRANLSSAIYPMTLAESGRTVIIPGPDQNFDRRVDPQGEQKDAGIPQAIYLENVLPTISGYQSVDFAAAVTPHPTPAGAYVLGIVETFASLADLTLPCSIIFYSNNTISVGSEGLGIVTVVGTPISYSSLVSTAVVNGVSYLYFPNNTLYRVESTSSNAAGESDGLLITEITATVTPAGFLGTTGIIGIAGSNNYLIAFTRGKVYYSSLTTSTDFVTSLISGAGFITPENLRGVINLGVETENGFYIIATESIILAKYTGNSRYPWKFLAVKNSSGISNVNNINTRIYCNASSAGLFIIENNRQIKFISGDIADNIAPEITNYLLTSTVEDRYDALTETFIPSAVTTVQPNLYILLNRYICVSVSETLTSYYSYDYVLVYDLVLQRYGKLKLKHSFLFTSYIQITIKNQLQTVKLLGLISGQPVHFKYMLPFNNLVASDGAPYNLLGAASILLLGKFQYVRSRFIKLEELEFEGPVSSTLRTALNFSCNLYPSLDGRNFNPSVPLIASDTAGSLVKFPAHTTAQNISILVKGNFNLSSVQIKFTAAGNR